MGKRKEEGGRRFLFARQTPKGAQKGKNTYTYIHTHTHTEKKAGRVCYANFSLWEKKINKKIKNKNAQWAKICCANQRARKMKRKQKTNKRECSLEIRH